MRGTVAQFLPRKALINNCSPFVQAAESFPTRQLTLKATFAHHCASKSLHSRNAGLSQTLPTDLLEQDIEERERRIPLRKMDGLTSSHTMKSVSAGCCDTLQVNLREESSEMENL